MQRATQDWCLISAADGRWGTNSVRDLTNIYQHKANNMKPYSDPHTALGQALTKGDATTKVTASSSRPWASITFSGLRHRYTLHFGGPEAEAQARAMAASVSCDEFHIRGHLVADIAADQLTVTGDTATLEIEALTVEAG
jgi:hypothetical protein